MKALTIFLIVTFFTYQVHADEKILDAWDTSSNRTKFVNYRIVTVTSILSTGNSTVQSKREDTIRISSLGQLFGTKQTVRSSAAVHEEKIYLDNIKYSATILAEMPGLYLLRGEAKLKDSVELQAFVENYSTLSLKVRCSTFEVDDNIHLVDLLTHWSIKDQIYSDGFITIVLDKPLPDGKNQQIASAYSSAKLKVSNTKPFIPIELSLTSTDKRLLSTSYQFKSQLDINGSPIITSVDKSAKIKKGESEVTYYTHKDIITIDKINNYNTLSAFGLPEPEGVVWEKPIPPYVWYLSIAGGAAAIMILCGWLLKRRAKARAAAVSKTSAPIPPAKPM